MSLKIDYHEVMVRMKKDVDYIAEEAYKRGYDKGYADKTNNDKVGKELAKDIYQRGLNDAWEASKKVVLNPDEGGLDIQELNEVFNCATIQQVFRRYTLSEVIAKLKAYEEKRKADEEIGHDIGKWKDIVEGIECAYGTCGTCGTRIPMAYKYYEYCPHCGTKNEVTT